MKRAIILIILVLIIISCKKDKDTQISFSCFQVDNNDNTGYKVERKWEFLGFFNNDTRKESCKPGNLNEMNIEFSDTNRFHAISLCNTFDGYYAISNNTMKIDSVITTLILCVDDTSRKWETDYLTELKKASGFKILRNILVIETSSPNDIIFKAE
jgi:heat shock protein HslJ